MQLMLVAVLAPEVMLTIAFMEWMESTNILTDILRELF